METLGGDKDDEKPSQPHSAADVQHSSVFSKVFSRYFFSFFLEIVVDSFSENLF